MKKKLLILFTVAMLSFNIGGCGSQTMNVNVENCSDLYGNKFGISNLIKIGDNLYYDSTTRNIYFWNGYCGVFNYATTPSAYLAPNGLPYKYNPVTNTFYETTKEEMRVIESGIL